MMAEDCRGGYLLGKFVSYLHNYLGAPVDAKAKIVGLIYSKSVCLLRDCAGGLSCLIKRMFNSFSSGNKAVGLKLSKCKIFNVFL